MKEGEKSTCVLFGWDSKRFFHIERRLLRREMENLYWSCKDR